MIVCADAYSGRIAEFGRDLMQKARTAAGIQTGIRLIAHVFMSGSTQADTFT